MNWHNEKDAHAAEWLRNLISLGELPDGAVDERSIVDVRGDDLAGYDECHFFAGIGVWPRAIAEAERASGRRLARPLFTGSCPCQPISVAGQRQGHVDERHLWPAFHRLIAERRPATIIGEQVAGKDGREWMAAVRHDLEASGYAVGTAILPAGGFGAPHIRYRLFFVAQSGGAECGSGWPGWTGEAGGRAYPELAGRGDAGGLADAERQRRQQISRGSSGDEAADGRTRWDGSQPDGDHLAASDGATGGLADAAGEQEHEEQQGPAADEGGRRPDRLGGCRMAGLLADAEELRCAQRGYARELSCTGAAQSEPGAAISALGPEYDGADGRPRSPDSFWSDPDWIFCRDGKWRPIEPGSFPLVDGASFKLGSGGPYEGMSRAGMLRGYGNAVVLPVARAFVEAVIGG